MHNVILSLCKSVHFQPANCVCGGFYLIRKYYPPSHMHDIDVQSTGNIKSISFGYPGTSFHLNARVFQNNYTNILYLFVWFFFICLSYFLSPNGKRHRIVRNVFLCLLKCRYLFQSKHAFPISIPTGSRSKGQPICRRYLSLASSSSYSISFDFLSHFTTFTTYTMIS